MALHGVFFAGGDQYIVHQYDPQTDRDPAGAAAFLRRNPQRDADQDKNKTDKRKRELLVDLDPMGTPFPGFLAKPEFNLFSPDLGLFSGARGGGEAHSVRLKFLQAPADRLDASFQLAEIPLSHPFFARDLVK